MRTSPIRELLARRGATFEILTAGVETAARFSTFEQEYQTVREGVGLCDFSFTTRHRVKESGLDALEAYAAGAVSSIRFGRVLHTMAVDEAGLLESDLYIANDDEHLLVIGEHLVPDAAVNGALGAAAPEDLTDETALFGIDGYKAYAVAKALFGADVLGLPYLSLETYTLDGVELKVIRGGKTSEFGYLVLVPKSHAVAIWERIEQAGAPFGLGLVGFATHRALRLDGRFFNIHDEGRAVRDPLSLGLQWMIDLGGDDFRGKAALMARRADGVSQKLIGVVPAAKSVPLMPGMKLLAGGEVVAEVICATPSPTLGSAIGLALFAREYAYAGLTFSGEDGAAFLTLSMPPFLAKSLTVKLDEV